MQWNPHQADFGVEKGRLHAAEARMRDVSPKVRLASLSFVFYRLTMKHLEANSLQKEEV